jgi:hypothetical protein
MIFMGEEATKISVNIKVEVKLAGGVKDHTLIASPLEVPDDGLVCDGVQLFRLQREPGNLADSKGNIAASVGGQVEEHTNNGWVAPRFKGNIAASVGGQVEEHTNNGWVAPRFIHRWTIRVGAETGRIFGLQSSRWVALRILSIRPVGERKIDPSNFFSLLLQGTWRRNLEKSSSRVNSNLSPRKSSINLSISVGSDAPAIYAVCAYLTSVVMYQAYRGSKGY